MHPWSCVDQLYSLPSVNTAAAPNVQSNEGAAHRNYDERAVQVKHAAEHLRQAVSRCEYAGCRTLATGAQLLRRSPSGRSLFFSIHTAGGGGRAAARTAPTSEEVDSHNEVGG